MLLRFYVSDQHKVVRVVKWKENDRTVIVVSSSVFSNKNLNVNCNDSCNFSFTYLVTEKFKFPPSVLCLSSVSQIEKHLLPCVDLLFAADSQSDLRLDSYESQPLKL